MNNKKLTIDEYLYVRSEVNSKQKSVFGSYALAILLGPIGVHRAYLGKFKSGLARAALTIITLAVLLTAVTTVDVAGVDTATSNDVLVYNAIIALLLIGLATANVIWSIIDLLFIPKWIKETEETHENIATEKAIQSRYVAEGLLRKGFSENLYKEVKKEVTEAISSEVNEKLKKLNLRQDVEFRPKHTLPSYGYRFGTQEEFDLETAFCKQAQEYENKISIDDLFLEEILEEHIEGVQNIPENLIEDVGLEDIDFSGYEKSDEQKHASFGDKPLEEKCEHIAKGNKIEDIEILEKQLIESLIKKEDHCAPEEQVVDTNTQWENENTLQWKDNQSYKAQHETNTDINYEKETISEDFNLSLNLDLEEDDDEREIPNFVTILNFDSEEDEETDDALLENEETLPEAKEMPKEIIVNEEKYNERKERAIKRSKQAIGSLVNQNDKKSKKKKDKKRGNFLFFRKRSKTKA